VANEEYAGSGKSASIVRGPQSEEIRSLKAKMEIDATIVASQQAKIDEMDEALNQSMKDKAGARSKHEHLEKQIDLLEETIHQHDEVVSHVRKVSTILQEELSGKEADVSHIQKQLEMVQKEKLKLEEEMESREREAEKRLESFQMKVRDQSDILSNLLRSLREKEKENEHRIQNNVGVLQDELATKDIELSSLERQLAAALTRNAEITDQLAEKDREINMKCIEFSNKIQEQNNSLSNLLVSVSMDSSNANKRKILASSQMQNIQKSEARQHANPAKAVSEECSWSITEESRTVVDKRGKDEDIICLSANDIREKQSQLQDELRDIYAQIKAVVILPGKRVSNSQSLIEPDHSPEDSKDNGDEYDLRKSFGSRRREREEIRPWRKREDIGEVYNSEAWGQRSEKSGCSVYSM